MDDIARPAPEDGVKLVFTGCRKAGGAAILETRKSIAEIPAPGPLADVAGERADISNLRSRHAFGRPRKHREIAANHGVPAERVQRYQTADGHAGSGLRDLIQLLDGLEVDDHIRRDDPLLGELQQVTAATGKRSGLSTLPRLSGERDRVSQVARVCVSKCLHA